MTNSLASSPFAQALVREPCGWRAVETPAGAQSVLIIHPRFRGAADTARDFQQAFGKRTGLVTGPQGEASCVEVEVVRRMRRRGLGCAWISEFRGAPAAWRWAILSDDALPAPVRERHARLRTRTRELIGTGGGCWDVLAWDGDALAYLDCKGPRDRLRPGQRAWRAAAAELEPRIAFLLVEWTLTT